MKEVKEFVIKRSEWARGPYDGGSVLSALLCGADHGDHRGKRCCVGIYLAACGVPDDELLSVAQAEDVVSAERGGVPPWLLRLREDYDDESQQGGVSLVPSKSAESLYDANDERGDEAEIARLFAAQGITVRFED